MTINGYQKWKKNNPIKISEFTGMQGIPEVTIEGCNVKTRLNPSIKIGNIIDVESEFKTFNFGDVYFREIPPSAGSGRYGVYKLTHTGDSYGDDWTTSIVGFRGGAQ